MKGPESYLKDFLTEVECPVTHRPVTVDSTRRVHVGHDLFYVADAAAAAELLKHPQRYAKALSDPVTQQRFAPTGRSPHVTHRGRPYFFASPETMKRFRSMPDSFVVRKGM